MTSERHRAQDDFLKDIANHEMQVLRDDGIDRRIRFKQPGTSAAWFDLITWNGTLCIDGDYGTYVFRRLEDMFEFFRPSTKSAANDGLKINPGYWGEKLVSTAKHEGYMEFSETLFREAVKHEFDSYLESNPLSDEQKDELWEEIEQDVLSNETEHYAVTSAMNFETDICSFNMNDFHEHRVKDFSYHYIWCLNAIVWGIDQYDRQKLEHKEREVESERSTRPKMPA